MAEPFKRRTISFYRYVIVENPQEFRDQLYKEWAELNCFGRIYIAREGINAQMSVPENNLGNFLQQLDQHPELKDMPIKYAIEDDGKSFFKLTIKVRPKIVADGLDDGAFDVTNVGKHLSAIEFHEQVQKEDTIVIDMRNHYESEVGRFEGAICPDADTFRDEIQMVVKDFEDQKDKKFLLYCTGGIRCEKASAYLRHHGFKDVNQLMGGSSNMHSKSKNSISNRSSPGKISFSTSVSVNRSTGRSSAAVTNAAAPPIPIPIVPMKPVTCCSSNAQTAAVNIMVAAHRNAGKL
jgi:UPF0176 protein